MLIKTRDYDSFFGTHGRKLHDGGHMHSQYGGSGHARLSHFMYFQETMRNGIQMYVLRVPCGSKDERIILMLITRMMIVLV